MTKSYVNNIMLTQTTRANFKQMFHVFGVYLVGKLSASHQILTFSTAGKKSPVLQGPFPTQMLYCPFL